MNLTWKRISRDLDDARVKPMYKTKRTLRRDLNDAHMAREAAIEERKDVHRLLAQETRIAQDAIRERDEARRERDAIEDERDSAQDIAWDWKEQHDKLLDEVKTLRKARDEAVALAGEYAKVLEDTYGYTPPLIADPADTPTADEHVEDLPAVFLELATEHKAEHPEVEGKTTTFYRLTPEQEAELRKDLPDVHAWDAFTKTMPVVPVKPKPRRKPARVPAQRGGDKS